MTYKIADAQSASLTFAGWTVLMSSMVVFSTLVGLLLGEWRGASRRTRSLLAAAITILVVSLVLIGWANKLKVGGPQSLHDRTAAPAIADGTVLGGRR